ncbi:MAG: protein translocase subunit SecF [Gammaproteobacteria bacterium]|nr:protein translocase subunit SecF [Gammaproteobacteria bacterium]
MEVFKANTTIDFLGWRRAGFVLSAVLIVISIGSLTLRGLNFGIDFTGGTLVEVGYDESVNIGDVREQLAAGGVDDAQVQYFGSSSELLIRLPAGAGEGDTDTEAGLSSAVMEALREPYGEVVMAGTREGATQECVTPEGARGDCRVQMRRVEFVGPQVGEQLTEQGGLAMIYALIMILIYVAWRFEWRFALGSVAALVHDVILTIGFFSIFQIEFSLAVLAAILAVIGYSLNDTIVVFDRIRENFRKMRKDSTLEIMNRSLNQTLSRTLITGVTTLLVLLALAILGGEVIWGFSLALIVGVIVGTYSSIYTASPVVLSLGVSKEDLIPPKKEGEDQENVLP